MVPTTRRLTGAALLLQISHRSMKAKQTQQGCRVNANWALRQSQLTAPCKSRQSQTLLPQGRDSKQENAPFPLQEAEHRGGSRSGCGVEVSWRVEIWLVLQKGTVQLGISHREDNFGQYLLLSMCCPQPSAFFSRLYHSTWKVHGFWCLPFLWQKLTLLLGFRNIWEKHGKTF